MASSVPRPQAQDVLVTLSVKHPHPELQYPERRIVLEQNITSVVIIGRSSKRFDHLEAKGDNCYFDSPVMSREHAKITVDWQYKKLFIRDIGSLHGTYHNSQRLQPRSSRELMQHDILKFGIDIQRSNELFPPCTVEVEWEWDHLAKTAQTSNQANTRPSFSVPDDSDSSDDDYTTESDIRTTVDKLRKVDMQKPTANPGRLFASSIDLTMDSPMYEPDANGQAGAPIVIDEDIQKRPQEPVEPPSFSARREEIPVELDAPHDEDEVLPSSPNNHRQLPVFASDSESDESNDDSYDEESYGGKSSSYPDERPSSQDQMPDSCDEDINLSSSESEDRSDDDGEEEEEEDLEDENESVLDMESESERLGASDYAQDRPMVDSYVNESDAGEPDSTLWADEDANFVCSQPLPEANTSHQPCYVPASWQPEQPITQAGMYRPFRTMPMPALPPIVWPSLPVTDQGEQERLNDFRLPSILNPTGSQLGSLPGTSTDTHPSPTTRSREYLAQRDAVPPNYTPWQKAYETPKSVPAAVGKDPLELPQTDGWSAGVLGQITGKTEYFAAREHNKVVIRRQEQHHDSSQPKNQIRNTTEVIAEASTSEPQPISASNGATVSAPVKDAPKSTNVAGSVWSASGDNFLNTPQDFPLSDVRNASPELDMTSAYQFHQSKLASSQLNTTDAARPATIESEKVEQSTILRSPKRKADELSVLVPEEEAIEAAAAAATAAVRQQEENPETAYDETQTISEQAPSTTSTAVESVNRIMPPPPKRLRSFLSKAGYFFGGGVVTAAGLVTALAVTAPAL